MFDPITNIMSPYKDKFKDGISIIEPNKYKKLPTAEIKKLIPSLAFLSVE
jgi:hypothetical protein